MSSDIQTTDLATRTGELVTDTPDVLGTLNRAEIDVAIATANRYPRSIKQFVSDATELATLDEDTAASMFYVLPRGGKKIEGASIRLAEVIGHAYGNLRYGGRIVHVGARTVTAQGVCFDLQKNLSATVEAERRITDKSGKRYPDDMIVVTCQAAISIAIRNAIFRVVPRALWEPIYRKARAAAIGSAESMASKREKLFVAFSKLGASEADVLAIVGRKGREEVTLDDLQDMRGVYTSLTEGLTTIESVLAEVSRQRGDAPKNTLSDLTARLARGETLQGPQDASNGQQGPTAAPAPPDAAAGHVGDDDGGWWQAYLAALEVAATPQAVTGLRRAVAAQRPDGDHDDIAFAADQRLAALREGK